MNMNIVDEQRVYLNNPNQLHFLFHKDGSYDAGYRFTHIDILPSEREHALVDVEHPKVLCLLGLYYKCHKVIDQRLSYFNCGGRGAGVVNYDRMLVCIDPLAHDAWLWAKSKFLY